MSEDEKTYLMGDPLKEWAHNEQPLPTNPAALKFWCDQILKGFELPEYPDYHRRIAETIMHLPQNVDSIQPIVLVRAVKRAMSNQVAYNLINQIKTQQAEEAEAAKKAAEALNPLQPEATQPEASNGAQKH